MRLFLVVLDTLFLFKHCIIKFQKVNVYVFAIN